ncbi:amidohydrolase family protein [Hymenobacter sp. 15J16-1T3B]|uniref:amidohydrolase family protein n=1 Tax=Hymenobacter sp. 15J16-1T3B TaxID=2886941 RepID=UPI001D0F7D5D|nr:amidohydrolase family protein [Hymenobacter sp. 15J16-1T3B]MCC3156685.1 amidohydrolase family protein [Hymenobacter sp. 15J16-1T3B]
MDPRLCAQRLLVGSWLAVAPLAGQAQAPAAPTVPVVIRNVNVVDVRAGQVISGQLVVIRGECIDAVGRRAPAGGAVRVIDGRGKYLIPGLCDAHSHALASAQQASLALPQYLLSGVTSVRDVSSTRPYAELAATAQAVETGAQPGPHLVLSGANVDGMAGAVAGARLAQTAAQAREQAVQLAAEGWASISAQALLPAPAYAGLAAGAAERRVPLTGHVPEAVTLAEALQAGQRCLEHLDKLLLACSPREAELVAERAALLQAGRAGGGLGERRPVERLQQRRAQQQAAVDAAFSPGRCALLAEELVRRGSFVVPLLGADAAGAVPAGPLSCARWHGAADSTTRALHRELVAMLHHEGVRLLAGSEASSDAPAYGRGLLEELERLVAAGLPPADALLAATLTPAALLGRQTQQGEVAPNQQADLVLLDANPLDDIRNLRRVRTVIVRGRVYDRAALDALAAEAAQPVPQAAVKGR